ncbi:MAG: OmpA family protein, partial [Hyphomonadaceae bacterium]|nr:OmpA family protein [Hyphomonadaceae bacterium]
YGMARRLRQTALGSVALMVLAACGGQSSDPQTSRTGELVECVPIEEGALYRVVDGKLTAAEAPDPVIIERVVEPELTWTERLEASFPDLGFPWMQLDSRNADAGVVTLTGLAPTADAKGRALDAGESAIKATPQGRDLLIIDGISVEGGEEAVGAALGTLTTASSVEECQAAFIRVMEGRNVSFRTAGASINDESARLLDAASAVATLCQDYEIEIGGHTDSVGNAINNQRLSERRAESVRQFLISKGAPAEILVAVGYGESELLDTGDTPEAHARNRRTEFTVRER